MGHVRGMLAGGVHCPVVLFVSDRHFNGVQMYSVETD